MRFRRAITVGHEVFRALKKCPLGVLLLVERNEEGRL
jgi:hypothetical protein